MTRKIGKDIAVKKRREIGTRIRLALSDAASTVEFRNTRWLRTAWMNFRMAISALWWRERDHGQE